MSPSRPKSPGSHRNDFKPYTRALTATMIPQMSRVLQDSNFSMNDSMNDEHFGFPTYAQYKQVEDAYIQSLTPRRQAKALISQSMFDRVWDVLHHPECQGETAQFRFWARKMFTLSKNHRNTLGIVATNDEIPQEVLLHDNLLVAVQEQLYDLLCYCHGITGHGGRDKTCAFIRKHYTWVPKDLVSGFIKTCPTCIMKKCGGLDLSLVQQSNTDDSKIEDMSIPALQEFYQNIYSQDQAIAASSSTMPGIVWPSMRDSVAARPILLEDDPLEAAYREAILRARDTKAQAGMSVTPQHGLQGGVPMSREVSLYRGLPNGWQFHHIDYASTHAEFTQTRNLSTHAPSSSLERAAAPPRLDLDALSTEKSFQTFMAYRESLGENNISPDGSVMNWHPGNSSSQLSYIASPTGSVSPPTTALPTPVDEYGTDDPCSFVKGKGKLNLEETAEMELSSSIDYGL